MKKSLLILLLLALIAVSLFGATFVHFGKAQTVSFQLHDSNGNPVSSVIFVSVAPGSSSTISVTMSSSNHATVYPIWTLSNLPTGDTISGYWNGPEVWNVNTGRMWNTWDVVTLQWTLSVPENSSPATNVMINVIVDSFSPTISPTPTKQQVSSASTDCTLMEALAIAAIIGVILLLAIKYIPRERFNIKTNKFPIIGGFLIFVGTAALLGNRTVIYSFGNYTILWFVTAFITMCLAMTKRLYTWTKILTTILIVAELFGLLIIFQTFSYSWYNEYVIGFFLFMPWIVSTLVAALWFISAFYVTFFGFALILKSQKEFKPLELRRRLRDYLLKE